MKFDKIDFLAKLHTLILLSKLLLFREIFSIREKKLVSWITIINEIS